MISYCTNEEGDPDGAAKREQDEEESSDKEEAGKDEEAADNKKRLMGIMSHSQPCHSCGKGRGGGGRGGRSGAGPHNADTQLLVPPSVPPPSVRRELKRDWVETDIEPRQLRCRI